ncbi:hypothetical protein GCM10010505_36120 [Kitasatospora aburaviensis]
MVDTRRGELLLFRPAPCELPHPAHPELATGQQADIRLGLLLRRMTIGRPSRRVAYWRAMCMRISLSASTIRSPDRSTVTLWRAPVKRNGAW